MTATPREASKGEPRVVIIGGGFAGLNCARGLRRFPGRVTVIDRQNHHLFQPLLYQVATAVLSPADIAAPIRSILRDQANVDVVLATVLAVEPEARRVQLGGGAIDYDTLVIGTGVTHSYFGHDDWPQAAPGLKTVDDALEIRRRILLAFEEAEHEVDDDARRAKLTFVVVGAGPTGVELAGALKEIAARSIPRDFRHIDTKTTRVILVEAGDRVLAAMPERLSDRARRDLEAMGVEVRLGSQVTAIDDRGVRVGDTEIPAENVFWAAGVEGTPIAATLGVDLDPQGRVLVEPDLSVPGRPAIFVVGDLAHVKDRHGDLVPGVAPAAMQMGRHVARQIVRPGAASTPFRYRDKGSLATIGRARAVAVIGGRQFSGLIAWVLWSVVHVFFLIGFRRRLFVMLSWTWNYFAFWKGARLITGRYEATVTRPRDSSATDSSPSSPSG